MTLPELIQDLRVNHEHCPKEIILEAASMLEVLASILNPKQERNFCPRCGKRLKGITADIHTCTPPVECCQQYRTCKKPCFERDGNLT
jgi:NADH pyrophosphatase NudC (nudix superfamily)